MKYNVSELQGALLDAAVAKAAGFHLDSDGDRLDFRTNGGAPSPFHPSTDWRDGGPIIEREKIEIVFYPGAEEDDGEGWCGTIYFVEPAEETGKDSIAFGLTPLIAAMRAYATSKFGEEVDLP